MAIRSRTGLIKRYDLPMVYRKFEKDTNIDDPWDNGDSIVTVFEKRVAEECTIQTPSKNNTTPEMQGLDTSTMLVVYTNTFVPAPIEGSDDLPAAFYISPWFTTDSSYPSSRNGWYKVVSVQEKQNRVVSHYKVILEKDDAVKDDEYPDTTAFDAEVLTRDDFLSGAWEATWTQ
ncbi:minor head protein [Vibrio phage PWH3a-P1]|uniref:minor head protein n=1 Tax=Vibrio phage PWH3a-P1 TaxID=754058 RepID=UPI0002C0BEF3|nr:minor head protein [Vibrio phage PWH3a-P1]AGH32048.1 hypothetical protein VPIG_00192 [Vibrio phage PWH3a-P1]